MFRSSRKDSRQYKSALWARALAWLVLLLLLSSPELMHLSFLADGMGIELIVGLMEAQLLAFLAFSYRRAWRPVYAQLRLAVGLAVARRGHCHGLIRLVDGYILRNAGPVGLWGYVLIAAIGKRWLAHFS